MRGSGSVAHQYRGGSVDLQSEPRALLSSGCMKQPRLVMLARTVVLLAFSAGSIVVGKAQQGELIEAATGLFEVIMFNRLL